MNRKGSTENAPAAGSTAPSSETSALSVSPLTPATVQYVCSPENPRGQLPLRDSRAIVSKNALRDSPNASGRTAISSTP